MSEVEVVAMVGGAVLLYPMLVGVAARVLKGRPCQRPGCDCWRAMAWFWPFVLILAAIFMIIEHGILRPAALLYRTTSPPDSETPTEQEP